MLIDGQMGGTERHSYKYSKNSLLFLTEDLENFHLQV